MKLFLMKTVGCRSKHKIVTEKLMVLDNSHQEKLIVKTSKYKLRNLISNLSMNIEQAQFIHVIINKDLKLIIQNNFIGQGTTYNMHHITLL